MTPAERAAIRRRWEAASGSESAEIAREHFPALLAALDAAERRIGEWSEEAERQRQRAEKLVAELARLRALVADVLREGARAQHVENEWDAETNPMPLTCSHTREEHDGWHNEYDASRIDLLRAIATLAALAGSEGERK